MIMQCHPRLVTLVINHAGKASRSNITQMESLGGSQKLSKNKVISLGENNLLPESCVNDKGESSGYYDEYLWFGPRGNGGMYLY